MRSPSVSPSRVVYPNACVVTASVDPVALPGTNPQLADHDERRVDDLARTVARRKLAGREVHRRPLARREVLLKGRQRTHRKLPEAIRRQREMPSLVQTVELRTLPKPNAR